MAPLTLCSSSTTASTAGSIGAALMPAGPVIVIFGVIVSGHYR